MNPREELVSVLRGQFATPAISALADCGILDRMCKETFSPSSFPDVPNHSALKAVFRYLESLGLLKSAADGETFRATDLGQKVLSRSGACLILYSYRDYFHQLTEVLKGEASPTVDRRLNVIGSGSLHRRRFFPAALDMVRTVAWDSVTDVGCGDGTFLSNVRDIHPHMTPVLVDMSPIAIREAQKRLARPDTPSIVSDGLAVENWATVVPKSGRQLITMWFVIHEFSGGDPARIIDYLRRIAAALPNAEILIGEIVDVDPASLAAARRETVVPEFMLFHALSKQGVFSWPQHQHVLKSIPYTLAREKSFDPIPHAGGEPVPSSFIWHLMPNK